MYSQIVGENHEIYTTKINEIAEVIKRHNLINDKFVGIHAGSAGLPLFLYYYDRYLGNNQNKSLAFNMLISLVEKINTNIVPYNLSSGIGGLAWTIEHLAQNDFFEKENTEFLDDLDHYLYSKMIFDIKNGSYDFLHGALGVGLYFLNRRSKPKAIDYLVELVNHLESISIRTDNNTMVKWSYMKDGRKCINISLSHGISSIIIFLSKLYKCGIDQIRINELITSAINYILQQQIDVKKFMTYFPSYSIETQEDITPSRLGWCYGDLGVAYAIFYSASAINRNDLKDKALEILLYTSRRKGLKENSVQDGGLCHGSSGIALMFNRVFQETNIIEFKEASKYWYNITIDMASFNDGMAGYKANYSQRLGGWVGEIDFLNGVSGIGLSLISAVSNIEPKWDECLLLS